MSGFSSVRDLVSGNGGSGNDSESTSDNDNPLVEAVEAVNGSVERAEKYVDIHGSKDDLTEFAQAVAGWDEDTIELAEKRRRHIDMNRIVSFHLRGHSQDFTGFTGEFYGDTEDPEEGTYNYVQDKAHDADINMAFYKTLFPEPRAEYWPSEPVVWEKYDTIGVPNNPDDNFDSHIYLETDIAEEWADFTMENDNGNVVPRPPSNSELEKLADEQDTEDSSSGDSGEGLVPMQHTVKELKAVLKDGDWTDEQLSTALTAEEATKDRKMAKQAIKRERNELASDDSSDDDEEETPEETAGRLIANRGVSANPGIIVGMLEHGLSEDEVVDELT